MKWSNYQLNIFDWAKNGSGNALVNAVAGSGKTTTGIKAIEQLDQKIRVRCIAFNNTIKDILIEKTKFLWNVEVFNYNGFGFSICRQAFGSKYIKINPNKTNNILQYTVLKDKVEEFYRWRNQICKIISLMKGMGLLKFDEKIVREIMDWHDIEITSSDFPGFLEALELTWKIGNSDIKIMDFDDQLYVPIAKNLAIPDTDFTLVDEFQDTNYIQTQLIRNSKRIMAIGDPYQSIYGFRGSTPDAMGKFGKEMNATNLPLSICYRCPKNIVLEAKKIIPHIEWCEDNDPGIVESITKNQMINKIVSENYNQIIILCRCTAPLISSVLGFIRKEIPAFVKGKEIGLRLIGLIDKINDNNTSLETFITKLNEYERNKIAILEQLGKADKIGLVEDECETLRYLIEDCSSLDELVYKIKVLFKENDEINNNSLVHMTIHKSKGLEANTIYWLPHKMRKLNKDWMIEEEDRLRYVATTRALKELYYVSE